MAQPSNASLPDIVFPNERNRSKGSQANTNKPATAVNAKIDTVSYTNSTHTNDTNVSTEAPAATSSTHKLSAIEYWNNAEKNASNFPEAFGARLMRLNAEVGHEAADGAKNLYETLTDWNKFKSAVDGMYNTVTNPKETYKAFKAAAVSFAGLPADEKGEAAYKMLLGTLAGGGVAKAGAASVGKKIVPDTTNSITTQSLTGKYVRRKNSAYHTADDVNATFPADWQPPYKPGTRVTEFETTVEDIFVRVHGEHNKARSWMMKREALEGLSPEQIKSKYALPELPTYMSEIHVPAGTKVRTGTVNPLPAFNSVGNSTQYELLQRLPESLFKNTVRLDQ